jgi:hypothetical protein
MTDLDKQTNRFLRRTIDVNIQHGTTSMRKERNVGCSSIHVPQAVKGTCAYHTTQKWLC